MSTVFSGGTSLHWAKMTEMQYFVQNWVKRQERWRSITRNIGIGPCSHWLLQNTNNWQRKARNWNTRGKGQQDPIQVPPPIFWKRENKNKTYTGCWPAGLVCVAPCRKCYKTDRTYHSHGLGHKHSWGAFHMGKLLPRGPLLLSWTARERPFTQTYEQGIQSIQTWFTPFTVAPLEKLQNLWNLQNHSVSLRNSRSDLVEIFTQKAQLLMFTQKSLKCSHSHEITQNP